MLGLGPHFDVCDSIELCIFELTRMACTHLVCSTDILHTVSGRTIWSQFLTSYSTKHCDVNVVGILTVEFMMFSTWFLAHFVAQYEESWVTYKESLYLVYSLYIFPNKFCASLS